MSKGMARAVMYFGAAIFVAAIVTMTAGAARAQSGHACAYANDDVSYTYGPNTVDGYLVTTTAQTYISPFQTGGESKGESIISDIIVHPTKSVLYASDSESGDIVVMKINPATCQLTLLENVRIGGGDGFGLGLAISPDGKWVYAVGVKSATLYSLNVLPNGTLATIRQTIGLLNSPASLAVSPDSSTLLVGIAAGQKNGHEVVSYSIDATTGTLAQVSTVSPHGAAGSISIDSHSKFVYVNAGDGGQMHVGLMEIGPGSTLTFLRTENVTEVSDSLCPDAILSTDGKYLYVTDYNLASVTTLSVNDVTGTFKYLSTASYGVDNEERPYGLATSENGVFVFAGAGVNGYADMGIFAAAKNGSLTSLGTFPLSYYGFAEWLAAK